MNVTPTDKMYEAMQTFVDGLVGEAPTKLEKSTAANNRREARGRAMDWLHSFARLCMREGVRRYRDDLGQPNMEDHVRPTSITRRYN